jgi:hypothetical protein
MKMKTAISVLLTVIQMFAPVIAASGDRASRQEATTPQVSAPASAPQCETTGTKKLTVACAYTPSLSADANGGTAPRIILNHAVISFIPSDESPMRVELALTNDSGSKISDQRGVYLAIDDDKGENHMRRLLPHVDFTKLEPDRLSTFEETLLAPAFSPGRYVISIWIPSTVPSWKFQSRHNFLLSSIGVPDAATGLNHIAEFVVAPTKSE